MYTVIKSTHIPKHTNVAQPGGQGQMIDHANSMVTDRKIPLFHGTSKRQQSSSSPSHASSQASSVSHKKFPQQTAVIHTIAITGKNKYDRC